jgi:hypothetical protein
MVLEDDAGTRATETAAQLEKIGFVEFTVSLVRGVYEVIVEASIDQLKAYADLVNSVAKTLDQYQIDVVGEDVGEQHEKADSYIEEVLGFEIKDAPSSTDEIELNGDQQEALKEHFSGITITINEGETDEGETDEGETDEGEKTIEEATAGGTITLDDLRAFVIEKLKENAKDSYNLMVTILKIGMQKVVVTNGQIRTKLTFHVDATDTYSKTSMDYSSKSRSWGVRGGVRGGIGKRRRQGILGKFARATMGKFIGGGISGGYGSQKLNVAVVNEKSTAATNVTIDIIGEVNIFFRTETFPTVEV